MSHENQVPQVPVTDDTPEGLDLIGFLRRRKAFVLLLSLVGVGLSYLNFQRQTPQYRSDAMIQVIHRATDPRLTAMLAEKNLVDSDYVLKSPKTLGAAYRNAGLSELSTLRGLSEEDAVSRMAGMLSTKSLTANVAQIAATGSNPGDLQRIAQAAAEEYVLTQRENYKDASQDLRDLLSRARDQYMTELKTAEEEYGKFREAARLNTSGDNPFRVRAVAAQDKLSSLQLEKADKQATLAHLKEALRKGNAREAILMLIGKQTEASQTAEAQAAAAGGGIGGLMFPLLKQEAVLTTQLGEDHPRLKVIRLEIEMTRRYLREFAGVSDSQASITANEPAADFLTVYLQSLEEELRMIERRESELLTLSEKEDVLARDLMHEELEDFRRKNEIDRLSQMFNETTLLISEIQVNADMGGVTAQVLSPAGYGYLVYPIMSKFLTTGAFLGALAGLGLGYLVELADRSFRKPEDIIREFGVPIVGHIPFMTAQRLKGVPEASKLDRTAVSVHLPRSRPAEAYRAVRTAICFSAFGAAHRVLQVTSPTAGDGKSTLSLNLALSLAQSGKRTILLESDLRRPKVHKLTGVENKHGIVDLLRGETALADVIQETAVADFFVLPCGKKPNDPAELLARPVFLDILEALREQFEYVIIDTPPVLAVTDPCGVAARVDGVLLCMRLSRHTRHLGRRAIEQIRDVGGSVTGIVINGVEEQDAYGYGHYRYSDYRSYYKNYGYYGKKGYGYGYYGRKDGEAYYSEEPTAEESPLAALGSEPESQIHD